MTSKTARPASRATFPATLRRWLIALAVLLGIGAAGWWALLRWLPSDEELAVQASTQLQNALGVEVKVGALHWQMLPWPAVVIENVVTVQPQPIRIDKLTAWPDGWALLQRRIKIDRADLAGATVPQLSLRGLGRKGVPPDSSEFVADEVPLSRFVFSNVTWISRRGIPVVYDGEVDFDSGWRPRQAKLWRPGFAPRTELLLTRKGQEDRWDTRIAVGGGSANGEVWVEQRDKGRLHLGGRLQPRDVEVQSALQAFNRRSVIAGKASGETTLEANGDTLGELAQSLHTRTPFTMGASTLLKFDLDKAIRSAGKEHAGQTALDSITGQLDTQNSPDGMSVSYTGLKAHSGSLTASGDAKIANRRISAEFAVDLVDGLVGVPLKVNGPLDDVTVSVPSGAIAGAVIGTAVLPGVGTAIGARIGATLGKIFDGGPASRPAPAPAKKAR